MKNRACFVGILSLLLPAMAAFAQNANALDAKISVDASRVLNQVSPWLAGSCIEDVNHEIYGGLYDQKIFGESFEEPGSSSKYRYLGWTALGGEWLPDGSGVKVDPAQGPKLLSDAPAFGDGSVSALIKFAPNAEGNAGLIIRVSNAKDGADNFYGYEVSLEPRTKRLVLGKHLNNWQSFQNVEVDFNPTDWTKLRVDLEAARLRVYVGQSATPALDFTDPNAPLLAGTVGLRTWGAAASFRDLAVQKGTSSQALTLTAEASTAPQVSGMWDAIQNGAAQASFSRDNRTAYNGTWSQKIQYRAGTGTIGVANRGLNRWGIAVRRGQRLGGRLYLRGAELKGPVTLALQSVDGTKTYATQRIKKVSPDWTKTNISLTPNAEDANARFVVLLDKPGTLWIDQAVLTGTGAAQFKGLPVRADIGKMLQQQGIKFLRYGGTMVNAPAYRWKNMIGDPDKRPPYRGHWYQHSTNGFGIEEFLRFCEAAGFEPTFAINVEETDQDAADLVEYLNGDASSPWGKRRAENGHPLPYNVKWIELGNEEVIWSDSTADYNHYIARFNALATAMGGKDPRLQFISAAWWRPESPNMERVFKGIEAKCAYWDLHVWSDDNRSGVAIDRDIAFMQSQFKKWSPGTKMKCMILEENGNLHNQQRALGHATTLNAVRRHGDFVVVSCPANALQPDGQNDNGWDQGQIFFNPSKVWGMPPFFSAQMAAANHLPQRVQERVEGDLDVTATRSEDGKTVVLHIVNNSNAAKTTSISVSGLKRIDARAAIWTLAGALGAVNTPIRANVQTVQSEITNAGESFQTRFPATSYTIIRLTSTGN